MSFPSHTAATIANNYRKLEYETIMQNQSPAQLCWFHQQQLQS